MEIRRVSYMRVVNIVSSRYVYRMIEKMQDIYAKPAEQSVSTADNDQRQMKTYK